MPARWLALVLAFWLFSPAPAGHAQTTNLPDLDPKESTQSVLNRLSDGMDKYLYNAAKKIYKRSLMPACLGVAAFLLPTILLGEIAFIGYRIIIGGSIASEVLKFILTVLVSYTVIFQQLPQRIFDASILLLRAGGRLLGSEIMLACVPYDVDAVKFKELEKGLDVLGTEPIETFVGISPVRAWTFWIGERPLRDYSKVGQLELAKDDEIAKLRKYRFSARFTRERVFGDYSDDRKSETINNLIDRAQLNADKEASNILKTANAPSAGFLDTLAASLGGAFFLIFAPITAFTLALTAAGAIVVGQLTPVFTEASVLIGSYFTFYVALALMTSVVPLMFFAKFKEIWQTGLKFCLGIALIPMFYYILGSIGWVFSVNLFGILFPDRLFPAGAPLNGEDDPEFPLIDRLYIQNEGLGSLLYRIFNEALGAAKELVTGSLFQSASGSITAAANAVIGFFFKIYLSLGRLGAGASIISSFILAGNAFSLAASRIAVRWADGFSDSAILEKLAEAFKQVESAVGSGVASAYQSGIQGVGSGIGAFSKGIGGGK